MESFYTANTPSPASMAHTLKKSLNESGIKCQLHQAQAMVAKMLNFESFEPLSVQYKAHQKQQAQSQALIKKKESTYFDGLRHRAMQIDPLIKKDSPLGIMSTEMDYYRAMDPDYQSDFDLDYMSKREFMEMMEDSMKRVLLPRGFMMVEFDQRYVVVDASGLPSITIEEVEAEESKRP